MAFVCLTMTTATVNIIFDEFIFGEFRVSLSPSPDWIRTLQLTDTTIHISRYSRFFRLRFPLEGNRKILCNDDDGVDNGSASNNNNETNDNNC